MLTREQARAAADAITDPSRRSAAEGAKRTRRFFALDLSQASDAVPAELHGKAVSAASRYALRHPAHLATGALWICGTVIPIYLGNSYAYFPAIFGAVVTIRVRRYLVDRYIKQNYLQPPEESLERTRKR